MKMSKMSQKFIEEYGSGFTKDMEDFNDDDYFYKKWLLEIQPESDKPLTIEDLDSWKTIKDKNKPTDIPYNELGL